MTKYIYGVESTNAITKNGTKKTATYRLLAEAPDEHAEVLANRFRLIYKSVEVTETKKNPQYEGALDPGYII